MAENVDATQLSHAIGRLSWANLVQMTRLLCEKNDAVRDFYKERLFVNEEDVPQPSTPRSPDRSPSPSETSEDEPESTPPPAPAPKPQPTGSKRSRPRFAICINCKTEFDVMMNAPKICQYHWGEAEVDEEAFVDHDEFTHGHMDTEDNREAHPDNFVYNCCDRTSDEEGCTADWHRETDDLMSKRLKAMAGGL